MLKTLAAVFICAVVLSRAESLSGHAYIQNFWKGVQSATENNNSLLSDNNLESLIRHNIGLLKTSEPLSDLSKLLIEKYGKGTIFNPVLLNYVFVIESESIQLNKTSEGLYEGSPLKVDICSDSNSPAECILSRIYNETSSESIVNHLKQLHGEEKHFDLSYLYSTAPEALGSLKNYLLSAFGTKGAAKLFESRTGKNFTVGKDLESCVNGYLKTKYIFDLSAKKIFKVGTNDILQITPEKEAAVEDLMKDICSVISIGKLMNKEKDPSLVTFHVKSLNLLEKQLTEEEKLFLYDLWSVSYKKFIAFVMSKFSSEEISGLISFVKPSRVLKAEYVSPLSYGARILAETKAPTPQKQVWPVDDFQVGVWVMVSLIFVMFFAVMTLVTMDFQKDTLLYAKFLTVDNR